MNLLLTASLLLLQGGISLADRRPMDDFRSSCDPKSMKVTGRYATALCRTLKGDLRCSRLDLAPCIKNNYGSLQSDPAGSGPAFINECINCSNEPGTGGLLTSGPTLLHCQCNPKTGASQSNWPISIMDINILIDNIDGIMQCYGRVGAAATGC